MRRYLLTLTTIFFFIQAKAQTYGNEWIAYDQQYLKCYVAADGIYRIDYNTLNTSLAGIGVSLSDIDPRHFQLFNQGEEQYIFIAGEADGSFDPADFIEFLGKRNDGTFDTGLFDSAQFQLQTFESIISDTACYFLTWNDLFDNNRMAPAINDLAGAPSPAPYFSAHSRIVFGSGYGSANFNAGPSYQNVYSSKYMNGEGFTSPKYNLSTYNVTVNTPNRYAGVDGFAPTLSTIAIGSNEAEHHVVIKINASTMLDTTFSNYGVVRKTFLMPTITDANTVTFVSGPTTTDYQRYSFIDINYPRIFDFDNASRFRVDLPAIPGPTTYLEFNDMDEKGTPVLLYDLAEKRRMIGITEADITKFHIPYPASLHKLYVTSQDPSDIKSITTLSPVTFINYGDVANQGDFLIISHPSLFDDGTGTNFVAAYRDYRNSIDGGSYDARIANIDMLYDEFSYGIRKHPLAIRNYILYAVDHYTDKPKYVFLIGKSFSYDVTRANGTPEFYEDLVPTFGHPGADALLAARPGSVVQTIPIGRIAAKTADEVRIYLDKVIAFEEAQHDNTQTVANKLWMKNVLHFAGGLNEYEQALFNNYLNQYSYYIEDTLFGGNVRQFNKLSTDPIFYSESEYIDSLINAGISLATFFGHSSTGSFDFNIGEPEDLNNAGKYFCVYGNGCNTAAIHGESLTLGERYIFAEEKGAVAFIAASNFSLASSLNTYANMFYQEFSNYAYDLPLGDVLMRTTDTLWPTGNIYQQLTLEHTTLQGDPSLRLNTHPQPDYDIEAPLVSFQPDIITPGIDTFYLELIVSNLGMAIDSSYFVEVKRTLPDGSEQTFFERFPSTYYQDTLHIPFATGGPDGVGINNFNIHVDKLNEIPEIDELNNVLGTSVTIISDDAIPIYPVEFSIMNHVPEYFAASTSYVFAEEKLYLIEADTTMLFNSPLHQSTTALESGGVVYWNDPPMMWLDSTVYYWRITPDTSDGSEPLWRSSSFEFRIGDITGWNQSHYHQFLEDDYTNIQLQPSRNFEFVPDVVTYEVSTGIYPTTNWTEVTCYQDGELFAVSSCASAGFVVVVADANSGQPWTTSEVGTSNTGPYGDIYCSADPYERVIQFNTNTPERREFLYQFMMNTVPDSSYFICYSNNYAEFNSWLDDTLIYGHSLFDAFVAYGAVDINSLAVFDYDRSYIFYAQKGNPASKFELIGDPEGHKIEATFVIEGAWNTGDIVTPLIGPAASWDKAQWWLSSYDDPQSDTSMLSILGIDTLGAMTVLADGLQSGDTSLTFIDAHTYPYLKLQLTASDDSLRTPVQLDRWRVIYDPVPEAALNPNIAFSYDGDSLQQGPDVHLSMAVTNVSDYDMDSLLISVQVRDVANVLHPVPYERQDSLLTDETMIATLGFSSSDFPTGNNTLIVEVNPKNDQPEQYHFNNIAYLPFFNAADTRDPLLDVTFDGIHILDGDIVSSKPTILINLKDENTFLALNDTSLIDIVIEYPDGSEHSFPYDDIITRFYPADSSDLAENNSARVELQPVLEADGIYILKIHGEDVTGNNAGDLDYRISFEVINKAMISNVFNYPNPFSTSTRFVFTLTGSEVPEYFKIQIITVTGKVVREIMRSELGELHIGNNITEFAWDGTDQYGDNLANGLYLYRVVTRLDGKALENFETGTDDYFKSGYGKMYIAR